MLDIIELDLNYFLSHLCYESSGSGNKSISVDSVEDKLELLAEFIKTLMVELQCYHMEHA